MPPEKRRPGTPARPTPSNETTTSAHHGTGDAFHSSRYPWTCCRAESPRTEKRIDGWLAALEHLAAAGLPCTGVPDWVLRSLAARGGRARAVAELVHTAQCENLS